MQELLLVQELLPVWEPLPVQVLLPVWVLLPLSSNRALCGAHRVRVCRTDRGKLGLGSGSLQSTDHLPIRREISEPCGMDQEHTSR